MPFLRRSERSREESMRRKQPEEQRVWMEELEGRVMLSTAQNALTLNKLAIDTASAPVLVQDQPVAGELYDSSDYDLFAFDGEAGSRYAFDLKAAWWTGFKIDVTLWNQEGKRVMWCSDGCQAMPYTGTYYVLVSKQRWDDAYLPYTLSAREFVDDQDGGASAALALSIDSPLSGSIDYYEDEDWFKFQAIAGATYGFEARNTDGRLPLDIFSADGKQVDPEYKTDQCCASRLEWVAPSEGVYYLRVGSSFRTNYTLLSAQEKMRDELTSAVVPVLAFSSAVGGTLDYSVEVQYFRFQAVANAT
jgi:hypothetical protein